MALNTDIRFRVTPKLRTRAERVVRLLSAGKANRVTISSFGREEFLRSLESAEKQLGIGAEPKAAA